MTENCASKLPELPGYNCGLCGSRSCEDFAKILIAKPEEIKRCIHIERAKAKEQQAAKSGGSCGGEGASCSTATCSSCSSSAGMVSRQREPWKDSLGREFDFILDTFPNEPGPRETIIPHNPMITRELDVKKGDILIGRPLGMSCGCPITHCGVAMSVDQKTGVIVWCVTGPLGPRANAHKDLGYYSAEAYDGIITESNKEIKIGMRCWFMPHRCMLQWRHSGLVNFLNRGPQGLHVRVEGLLIG